MCDSGEALKALDWMNEQDTVVLHHRRLEITGYLGKYL